MKIYTGHNLGTGGGQEVTVKDVQFAEADRAVTKEYLLPLKPSLELYNHSPSGFQWGYGGSGPAQLSLAILLDLTGNPKKAMSLHQEFKRHLIATAGPHLAVTEAEILAWLKGRY
ncbi:MAG: DUF6166 domain-containing protein [Dehalococcoidales bacterium]|nr:DUF6166 domain-containing protein [Dehalococcoidales bacterium]